MTQSSCKGAQGLLGSRMTQSREEDGARNATSAQTDLSLTLSQHLDANLCANLCSVCSMNIVHLRVYLQCAMYMVLNMVQGEPRTPLLCFHVFECKLICVSKPLAVCQTVATYILRSVYVCAIVHVFLHIYILMCACVRVCVFGGPPFGPQHSSIESEYFVRGGQY